MAPIELDPAPVGPHPGEADEPIGKAILAIPDSVTEEGMGWGGRGATRAGEGHEVSATACLGW
jgi:hypothetical protein